MNRGNVRVRLTLIAVAVVALFAIPLPAAGAELRPVLHPGRIRRHPHDSRSKERNPDPDRSAHSGIDCDDFRYVSQSEPIRKAADAAELRPILTETS